VVIPKPRSARPQHLEETRSNGFGRLHATSRMSGAVQSDRMRKQKARGRNAPTAGFFMKNDGVTIG
jgi:hypothetical protein